ncbi:hypothetical protein ACF0H5_015132 [Mactra antiquata]
MTAEGKRRVIIAVDGSGHSDNAFQWYIDNLMKPDDYVYGVLVPEYKLRNITVGPFSDPEALSKEFGEQHARVEKMCSNYTATLRSANCKGQVDSYPTDKSVGAEICEQAGKLRADVIVMGTRGMSQAQQFIMGSISNYVMHHARCPVTVVPMSK